MPLIGTTGAASVKGFGFTATAAQSSWVGSFQGLGSGYTKIYGLTNDGAGNLYVVGTYSVNATTFGQLTAKISSDGVLSWQRGYAGSTGTLANGFGIAYSSSANAVAFTGYIDSDLTFATRDSSGNLSLNRVIVDGGGYSPQGRGVSCDSSGNFYVAGWSNYNSGAGLVQKFNSSGAFVYQNYADVYGSGEDKLYGIALNPVDNSSYYFGRSISSGGTRNYFLSNVSSAGSLAWSKFLSGTGITLTTSGSGSPVACDSSGNVYFCGYDNSINATYATGTIAKYNSSGTLQWQTYISNVAASKYVNLTAIAVDSSSNVYYVGSTFSPTSMIFGKLNSSGVLQWQRGITFIRGGSSINGEGLALNVNSTGLYVSGMAYGGNGYAWIFKMPTDGSLLGAYTNDSVTYTIAATSLTSGSGTLTDSSSGLSLTNTSYTNSASSATSSTTTLTYAKTIAA
jgi:hypothetical protein